MEHYSGKGSSTGEQQQPSSSSPQRRRDHNRNGGGPSDTSQEEANNDDDDIDDRKPPTVQVVAVVHHHQLHHQQLHRYHTDDNRSVSSQICESGYQSSGALSDGGTAGLAVFTATSSLRSAGSVSSHGSGGGRYSHEHTMLTHHQVSASGGAMLFNNAETRYALTAVNSYAASEAAKSDIATVCSGSVAEDIESIDGGMMNVHLPYTPNNIIVPSSHSERFVTVAAEARNRSVEFAPPTFLTASSFHHKQYSSAQAATPAAFHAPTTTTSPLTAAAHEAAAACDLEMNDMGPPLSRALLMQSLHQQQQSSAVMGSTPGGGSRPGSVKSYGSNNGASQNSDVVCHVDTDDCGGSLMESVTDGQSSVHSQEDVGRPEVEPHGELHGELLLSAHHSHHQQKEDDEEPMNGGTHPFLKNGSCGEHSNGRTSPGGTIYKGKGVRRYQGRYMNLPLKRFQQDAGASDLSLDTVLEADKLMEEKSKRREPHQERNGGYHHGYQEGDWRRRSQSPPKRNGRNNGYKNGGGHNNHMTSPEQHRYRGRGRSPSPARNRKNGYHHNHGGGGGETNGYHNGNGTSKNGNHHNGNGTNGGNQHHNGNHRHNNGGYSSSLDNRSRSRSRSRSNSPEEAKRNTSRRRRRNRDNGSSPRRRNRSRNRSPSPPSSSRRRSRQRSKGRSRS